MSRPQPLLRRHFPGRLEALYGKEFSTLPKCELIVGRCSYTECYPFSDI
jgi:hypothetical protein